MRTSGKSWCWLTANRRGAVLVAALSLPVGSGCGGRPGPEPPPLSAMALEVAPQSVPQRHADSVVTLVGAADIALCESEGDEATAHVIDSLVHVAVGPVSVFVAGDLAYPRGTREQFARCYDPSWGRFKAITRPVPGNHEYKNGFLWFLLGGDADPYFEYFDSLPGAAGARGDGWYRYTHGAWDIYALNTGRSGRLEPSSRQWEWLTRELASRDAECSLAFLHNPRFSAGKHGDNEGLRELWELLANHGIELWLAGHDHNYQRFRPQTGTGDPDPTGIRQFVVGTGGAYLHAQENRTAGLLEKRTSEYHGVLKLVLRVNRYEWEFVLTDGTVWDSGVSSCQNTRSAQRR